MHLNSCTKVTVFLGVFLILLFSMPAYAHPGRTDAFGGHTESATGQYHYHHGHEAHQHPNGVCPFGDYGEWLAVHGIEAQYDPGAQTYIINTDDDDSLGTWEEIGIGVGGAAAASAIGYGVYRKNRKKKEAFAAKEEHPFYEYNPNMTVFIANNGSRYHLRCGCCNAIQGMEPEEALNEGRTPCPTCCSEEMIEYSVKLLEKEQSAAIIETQSYENSEKDAGSRENDEQNAPEEVEQTSKE